MATYPLEIVADDGAIVTLRAPDVFAPYGEATPVALHYATTTGALVRVDGIARGAFDREHPTVVLPAGVRGDLTLAVERRALPATGLPARDGWRWKWMLANAAQPPARSLRVDLPPPATAVRAPVSATAVRAPVSATAARAPVAATARRAPVPLPLVGHSHLDVAWLWTYAEAARKAVRTFATAVRQLESDDAFVFAQSQPQLYAFVAAEDPELSARVRTFACEGRFDSSGAAMWVEADCNLPSGESLLRQLVFGMRYVEREFGRVPTVAWLPDSFGFPATLPTLLAHAGIGAFGTTKLGWNDTTVFPHARFWWEGPDGSRVRAAQIASLAGDAGRGRVRRARERGDLLLVGHGDGGGGVRDDTLAHASRIGTWTTLGAWFAWDPVAVLPVWRDELYLEEHRGTATTHHDVKARNAALERALGAAELALAWAKALHATPYFLDEARSQLGRAWELVLRAQFHDVLPGSAIREAYVAAFADYDEAEALVAHVDASARSVLPQARATVTPRPVAPRAAKDGFVFANDALVARVAPDGTLVDLRVPGGPGLVRRALRLAAYVDRPKRWDAWNVDRGYRSRPLRVRVTGCELADDALEIRYAIGSSLAVARVSLDANEGYLRVDLAVAWRERHVLLRVENALAFAGARARFGAPHGVVDRAPVPRSRAERAKFEAPGQRYARIDGRERGVALLALDTYGWSLEKRHGVTELGHSLLRGPTWPDPDADLGEHAFAFALAPCHGLGTGELETLWDRFAGRTDVPMFTSDDPALVVVATKLADDGDGIVVRARECDGAARDVALRCGARAQEVVCVDALERPIPGAVELREGALRARFEPFQLRSFRVRVAAGGSSKVAR